MLTRARLALTHLASLVIEPVRGVVCRRLDLPPVTHGPHRTVKGALQHEVGVEVGIWELVLVMILVKVELGGASYRKRHPSTHPPSHPPT